MERISVATSFPTFIGYIEGRRPIPKPSRQVDRVLNLRHGSLLDQLEAAFRALGKELPVQILDAA
jgi:hypothetical protein